MKILCTVIAFVTAAAVSFAADRNGLQSLTLSEAHDLALKNHPEIAAAEVTKESRAGYFPQANLYGSAVGADSTKTRIEAGDLNNLSVFDRVAGGFSLNQLLTDFGRTANLTGEFEIAR